MVKEASVIVITYNGKKHLKECFESLAKQTYKDFDTYLLDNGSTDGSSDFVKKNFLWVKIIRFNKNYGFTKGYNCAIKKVNTKYVILLNDDTKVDPRWLGELVKAVKKDGKIGAVGSKILFYDKPYIIQHAGGKITPIGAGFDIDFGKKNLLKSSNEVKYSGSVCGGAMLVRRKTFKEVGGFDEDYFAFFEDVDLCWRMWLFGYKVIYIPASIVYHKYGGSWGKRSSPERVFFTQRNGLMNLLKNFETWNTLKGVGIYILYTTIRILLFLKNREFQNIRACIQGSLDVLRKFKIIMKKRVSIQNKRSVSDKEFRRLGLLSNLTEALTEFCRLNKVDFSK